MRQPVRSASLAFSWQKKILRAAKFFCFWQRYFLLKFRSDIDFFFAAKKFPGNFSNMVFYFDADFSKKYRCHKNKILPRKHHFLECRKKSGPIKNSSRSRSTTFSMVT